MNKKLGVIALVAGVAFVSTAATASARCCSPCSTRAFAHACKASCAPAPCAPAPVVTKKIMVTQYVPQPYETTRTVYKTEYKDQKYTAYKCELVPEEHTRTVTYCKSVPETKDQVVTRYECVPTVEERNVTRMVYSTKQVTTMVNRCVDKGGHYECREVPCRSLHICGLFHKSCCDDCAPPPTRTVSVYVPNMVTEKVPVTTCQRVCTPVTEKVKVTVYKSVAKQETIKVTTCKLVMETKDEKCIVNVVKRTPYEATRKVAVCVPIQEKVTCTRMVPVQVEKEVVCAPTSTCASCGKCHLFGGLFHRGGCN
jgi:hypothetical protein